MKSTKLTLALAGLNIILVAIIAWQAVQLRGQRKSAAERASAPAEASVSRSSSSVPDPKAAGREENIQSVQTSRRTSRPDAARLPAGSATITTNRPKFDWRQVESEDYPTYIKRLREIGCPEPTVRDIVSADVLQAYAERRAEVMAERFRDFKFWKADLEESSARGTLETQRREVDDAIGAALLQLLGPDVPPPQTEAEWRQAALSQQLGFLPDDKRQATTALLQQYADVDAQIKELAWNHPTPESPTERRHVIEAYERKRTALRELLTSEEYETVDMTASWTADNLRQAMVKFQPTEDEFKIIFREWRTQDERLAGIFARGEADPGNEQVFAAIEKQLSPERYAKYRETWWK
jgi:hypothetical protein